VRVALHTGEADLRAGDYYGSAVNRCARLRGITHGGQTLLSQATAVLVSDTFLAGSSLADLGEHRLNDLQRPEHVFQLNVRDLPATFPPLRSLDAVANNLPLQLTSFVGREQEMAEVTRLLGTTRLLTLTGAGGAGKTRLAVQVAAGVVEDYPDGVWFVDLAPLADPALVPQTVATACGLRETPRHSALEDVVTLLRPRHVLLVLDNCEHLVDACAHLAHTVLLGCPHVCLLAASRAPLGLLEETVWRVPSLALPARSTEEPLERLTQYEGVRLFIERAVTARSDFQVTNTTAPALAEICWRLDGIPLAIELAAARVRVLGLEQIARRLDDRFRLLTGGSRAALPRHQTLQALVDWSYELLAAREQVLLRRLAVFAGGWTLEAAEEVCAGENIEADEVLDLLTGLVDKSLVVADAQDSAQRYRLLETIRQYAAGKLAASGEAADLARHHARWYMMALVGEATPDVPHLDELDRLAWLDREVDNLRAALRWSCEQGTAGDDEAAAWGLRLGVVLPAYWFIRARREGQEWLLRQGEQPQAAARTAQRAEILGVAAMFVLVVAGDSATARAWWEESVAIARETGQLALAADGLGGLAAITADAAQRQALVEEAVTLSRSLGDPAVLHSALGNLGIQYLLEGQLSLARDCLEQSRTFYAAVHDYDALGGALHELGNVARALGERVTARRLFEEKRALDEARGNQHGTAFALQALGELSEEEGDRAQAWTCYAGALTNLRDASDFERAMTVLQGMAFLSLTGGAPARALRLAGAVMAAQNTSGLQWRWDIAVQQKLAPHQEWEQIRDAAQQALGPQAAATAWAEGQAMTLEEAIAYALEKQAHA
jgi:predicted ATPase